MNQKGEVTLFTVVSLVVLTSLLLLCTLELQKSFSQLQKRTELFLCVKETKGEVDLYLKFMGRTNWALKNISKAKLLIMFIPGLQGAAFESEKIKKIIQQLQNLRLVSYLKTMNSIKGKSCPMDPRLFITPYRIGATGYLRDSQGAALLKEKVWTYHFVNLPYALSMKLDASLQESLHPQVKYFVEEKGAKLSSLFSSL